MTPQLFLFKNARGNQDAAYGEKQQNTYTTIIMQKRQIVFAKMVIVIVGKGDTKNSNCAPSIKTRQIAAPGLCDYGRTQIISLTNRKVIA